MTTTLTAPETGAHATEQQTVTTTHTPTSFPAPASRSAPAQDSAAPPDNAVLRRNLREAVRRIDAHLKQHSDLVAESITITGLATVPPPRIPVGGHLSSWRGFDVVVRCTQVRDVVDWCDSTDSAASLCVRAAKRHAELRLVTEINGGHYTVRADAAWLAKAFRVSQGEKRSVRPELLTPALEARTRRSSAAAAVVVSGS